MNDAGGCIACAGSSSTRPSSTGSTRFSRVRRKSWDPRITSPWRARERRANSGAAVDANPRAPPRRPTAAPSARRRRHAVADRAATGRGRRPRGDSAACSSELVATPDTHVAIVSGPRGRRRAPHGRASAESGRSGTTASRSRRQMAPRWCAKTSRRSPIRSQRRRRVSRTSRDDLPV